MINRGFSGYNTSQALKFFEQIFPKPEAGGPKLKYLVSPILHADLLHERTCGLQRAHA